MDDYKKIEVETAIKYGAVAKGTKKSIGDFLLDNNITKPVNVKSNNLDKNNYSPNIISAKRLINWLNKNNELYFIFVDYKKTETGIEIISDSGLVPIHKISWDCLTIESQGWGVIQMSKKLKINAGSAGAYSDETIADAITKIREQTKGNLYKVDLADEQIPKMLDWDKPFNKQHPEVQQALVNIANGEDEGSKMLKLMQNGNPSGKDIFHSLLTEPQLIDSPSGWISVDNKKEISKLLQSEGIPGIRYLDQGSRAAGAGTSNFVVFDPKHMNIIGRE